MVTAAYIPEAEVAVVVAYVSEDEVAVAAAYVPEGEVAVAAARAWCVVQLVLCVVHNLQNLFLTIDTSLYNLQNFFN